MYNVGDVIDARYEVMEELGRGGMGAVYRCMDRTDGSELALKCCLYDDPDYVKRFSREARSMKAIVHINIMPIIDNSDANVPPYFTMPLASKSVLEEIEEGIDEDTALATFKEICMGIQALHNANFTHRDIKPANAMRMVGGGIVVSDMGLVKNDLRDTTIITDTLQQLGTHIYMAPEQMYPGGSRDADAKTDIYLLGKTLYHMLTKEYPGLMDTSKVPPGLAYIIEKSTQNLPFRRYSSVGAMMDDLDNYVMSKNPDINPDSAFANDLGEANELAANGQYREENLNSLITSLLRFGGDDAKFVDQFDLIPNKIISSLSEKLSDRFLEIINIYNSALENVVDNFGFNYAELVARKMKIVFASTNNDMLKAAAMRAVLISAVELHRYAAMDAFDEMLTSIREVGLAMAVADMLRSNHAYYASVASRVPREALNPIIRPVYDAVL